METPLHLRAAALEMPTNLPMKKADSTVPSRIARYASIHLLYFLLKDLVYADLSITKPVPILVVQRVSRGCQKASVVRLLGEERRVNQKSLAVERFLMAAVLLMRLDEELKQRWQIHFVRYQSLKQRVREAAASEADQRATSWTDQFLGQGLVEEEDLEPQ